MDPLFYLFAIGSVLGYVLQAALLIRFARKMDGLSLSFYRNISFVVSLLPLLFGASLADIQGVLHYWPWLLTSGFTGGIYLALSFTALQYIAVSISSTLNKAISTITLALLGWLFLGQVLSVPHIILMSVILIGSVSLGIQRSSFPHLDSCSQVPSATLRWEVKTS